MATLNMPTPDVPPPRLANSKLHFAGGCGIEHLGESLGAYATAAVRLANLIRHPEARSEESKADA